ncbi:MAG: FeoB-associated Cys-rich membrane protein [Clostridia bacterium]|nr:FeoB-associated Cys-rich membrane protein [Clostridia bacterium]
MTETIIAAVAVAVIIGLALFYVIRSKRKGRKCIGCPDAKGCPMVKDGVCSCNTKNK